jgi:hypothetical protein
MNVSYTSDRLSKTDLFLQKLKQKQEMLERVRTDIERLYMENGVPLPQFTCDEVRSTYTGVQGTSLNYDKNLLIMMIEKLIVNGERLIKDTDSYLNEF